MRGLVSDIPISLLDSHCGKIMANWKKHNNLFSLLGLKQEGKFLEDDDEKDGEKLTLIQANAKSQAQPTFRLLLRQLLKIPKLKFDPSGYRLTIHRPRSQINKRYGQQGWHHRVHRVVTTAFWHTFGHEGKIGLGWWGWGMHAHPLSLHLPSPVKLQCTLQLSGQIH